MIFLSLNVYNVLETTALVFSNGSILSIGVFIYMILFPLDLALLNVNSNTEDWCPPGSDVTDTIADAQCERNP